MKVSVSVGEEDFDLSAEVAALVGDDHGIGAVATFTGLAREITGEAGETLTLEHYPGMTEAALEKIAREAAGRWRLAAARIAHRVGRLSPGDRIVLVACASRHRGDAFAAAEFIMDHLKTRAPFWKKETGAGWVDARDSDEAARRRWEATHENG